MPAWLAEDVAIPPGGAIMAEFWLPAACHVEGTCMVKPLPWKVVHCCGGDISMVALGGVLGLYWFTPVLTV